MTNQHQDMYGESNLLNDIPIMVWVTNEKNQFVFFNRAWLDYRGKSMEIDLNSGISGFVHPSDLKDVRVVVSDSFERRLDFELKFRLLNKNDEYRWVLCKGSPVINKKVAFEGFIGFCLDIHDEEEKRLSTARELEVLHSLNQMLSICSHCRKVRNENGEWLGLEEYLAEKLQTTFSHSVCPNCESDYRQN